MNFFNVLLLLKGFSLHSTICICLILSLLVHQNNDYENLCEETESLPREENESIVDCDSKIMWNYYRFHDDD